MTTPGALDYLRHGHDVVDRVQHAPTIRLAFMRKAFADAKVNARVEVFADTHGWCVPDMPKDGGVPIYNPVDAERAWAELGVLYKEALA